MLNIHSDDISIPARPRGSTPERKRESERALGGQRVRLRVCVLSHATDRVYTHGQLCLSEGPSPALTRCVCVWQVAVLQLCLVG